jgi:hypothetical protein
MDVHPVAAADYFARNKVTTFLSQFFMNSVFVRRKGEGGKILKPIDELDAHIKTGSLFFSRKVLVVLRSS